MNQHDHKVRNAKPEEFLAIGQLMVEVYSQQEGFPKQADQPEYYELLANVGDFTRIAGTELLVAVSSEGKIEGAVVYFNEMKNYGSGGTATTEQNTAGFRLLAVDQNARGKGIGKLLTNECINKARTNHLSQMIIHTTMAMQTAWKMYEDMGFRRSEVLDFMQGDLAVLGFRLSLEED
jgi:GNAT superfamily N-acetyltransferase